MKMLRFLLYFMLFIGLLLAATVSPWGTQVLLSFVSNSVEELTVEYDQGSLAGKLSIASLSYSDQSTDLKINGLNLDLGWQCLLTLRLCVEQLSSDSIVVKLTESETKSQPNEGSDKITLPYPMNLEQFSVGKIELILPDTTQVQVSSVAASLGFYHTLSVDEFSINKILVNLPPGKAKDNSPIDWQAVSEWQYIPPDLGTFALPIKVNAPSIKLASVQITQVNTEILRVSSIVVRLSTEYDSLTLDHLSLMHEQLKLELVAGIEKDYSLTSELKLNVTDSSIPIRSVNLKASGKPDALLLTMRSEGDMSLNAEFKADVISASLPLSAQIDWKGLYWPFETAQFSSSEGMVTLQGDMNAYEIGSNVSISGQAFPDTVISVSAEGNHKRLQLERLSLSTLEGNIVNTGELTLSDRLRWQGQSRIATINPGAFWPEYQAELNGELQVHAELGEEDFSLDSPVFELNGNWRNYQLLAKGNGQYSSKEGLNLPELVISLGDNKVLASGTISPAEVIQINAELDAVDLSQVLPELKGQSGADIKVAGTLTEPNIEIQSSIESFNYQTISLDKATLQGSLDWKQEKDIQLEVTIDNVVADKQSIDNLQLSIIGPLTQHDIALNVRAESTSFQSAFSGALTDTQWSGNWLTGELASTAGQFALDAPGASILANWSEGRYRLSPHCWRQSDEKLCIEEAEYSGNNLTAGITGENLGIIQLINQFKLTTQPITSDTKLDFNVMAQWDVNTLPNATLNATLSPALWYIGEDTPATQINQISVTTELTKQRLRSDIELSGKDIGKSQASIILNNIDTTRELEGSISLAGLNLSPAAYFTRELTDLSGFVDADIKLRGKLEAPLVTGKVIVRDGKLAGPLLPAKINQLNQEIVLTGQGADFSGDFMLGKGAGKISGGFSWQDSLSGDMKISGQNMEIDHQNILKARFSPDLNIHYSTTKLAVKGNVSVPYARVKVRELPPSALSPSKDVILINQPVEQTQSKTELDLSVQVNIDESKQNEVKIDAFGLTSSLQGALQLINNSDVIIGNGELRLVDGRYQAYGQDLIIRRGEVIFSGPMDNPLLDIEAIRDPEKTADDVIAGIRVEGVAAEPEISVFSTPEKVQSEAISYLLRGQSLGGSEETSGDAMFANALIGFGLSKSENKITRAGNKLGIDDLSLSTTGQGDDTKVAVSGYVAPGVQLRYGVGVFDSASEVALRYQIIPQLYLEAVSGLNNALDIYYQFSVGEQKNESKSNSTQN